jgi:acyl carrier protein
MCRWRHDGSLEYVGRRDRQVKIRGQRVEIEEVERILEAAPGVAACAVVKYEDSLHAVVVPEHGAIDEAKVRRHLEERLYRGIAPVSLLTVDELPHTTNGKIDHGAVEALVASWRMPEPNARDLPSADSEYAVTPAAVEDQHSRLLGRIMQIVTSCLQDPYVQVDVESDFFSLGGDSLAIAELLTVIEQEFGVILESDDLVKSPTPAFIASYIENHKAGQNALVGRRP